MGKPLAMTIPSVLSALPRLSRRLKYLIFLLLFLNVRSLPFVWHIRVLSHGWWLWNWRRRLSPNDRRFMEANSPIGKSPFEVMHVMRGVATLDDCEAFSYLSNSSYAKTLDIARLQSSMKFFPVWHTSKGVAMLGGTNYAFLKEIPVLSQYEMRTCIGGWDRKWLYLVTYFISYPVVNPKPPTDLAGSKSTVPPAPLARDLLPPGAVLHCIAVARYVFKQKRLTVPPAVCLSINGLGGTAAIGRARWERKELLRKEGKLMRVLNGAWDEEMNKTGDEVGWSFDELEEERKTGMEICEKIVGGLEDLRAVAAP